MAFTLSPRENHAASDQLYSQLDSAMSQDPRFAYQTTKVTLVTVITITFTTYQDTWTKPCPASFKNQQT
jgi:hypothetical protein